MPQVTTWKHPRKKYYTENKYRYLRNLKKDAYKNLRRKRLPLLKAEFQARYAIERPITSFVQYIVFLKENLNLLEKILAYEDNRTEKPSLCILKDFLFQIKGLCLHTDSKQSPAHVSIDGTDSVWSFSLPFLFTAHSYLTNHVRDRSGLVLYPYHRNFKFSDLPQLIKDDITEAEQQVILNRLSDDGMQYMPTTWKVNHELFLSYVLLIIDHVFEHKPITQDTIGKEVVLCFTDGKDNHCFGFGVVIGFNSTEVSVYVEALLLVVTVNKNAIKNIL